jgi:hypothetical protein
MKWVKQMKNKLVWIVPIILLVLVIPNVLSLGIVQDYLTKNTLLVVQSEPQAKTHNIRIPNSGDEPLTVAFELTAPDFVKITNNQPEYTIQPKSNIEIGFEIKVPADQRKVGNEWPISFTVKETASSAPGMVKTLTKVGDSFKVKVISLEEYSTLTAENKINQQFDDGYILGLKQKQELNAKIIKYSIYGIIILAVIIGIYYFGRKGRKPSNPTDAPDQPEDYGEPQGQVQSPSNPQEQFQP